MVTRKDMERVNAEGDMFAVSMKGINFASVITKKIKKKKDTEREREL